MKKQLPLKDRLLLTAPKKRDHATLHGGGAHEASGEERTVDKSLHCGVFEKKLVKYGKQGSLNKFSVLWDVEPVLVA